MLFAILIGVHVPIVAMARTAVQSAADAGVAAAQTAGDGSRESEGILGARIAMAGARGSVAETRLPAVLVEPERGTVRVIVYGSAISPVLGNMEFRARSCGPLDDVPASQLVGTDIWEC